MANYYRCNACKMVFMLVEEIKDNRCPSCGGTNGEVLSKETVNEGVKRGAYFNIGPRTGKRAKKKRR
jgi:rRNA maturation endonuclease Nob1